MTNLFQQRRKIERAHNLKLLTSVVDWTVALYIVIPAIVIGFFLYKDFLLDVQASWVAQMPLALYIGLLFVLTGIGTIRTYLHRADRLFLIQNHQQIRRLKQAGLYWTLSKHLCVLVALLAALAPIFVVVYHVTFWALLTLLLLLFTMNFCYALLQLRLPKLLQFVSKMGICAIGFIIFFYVPTIISVLICCLILFYCTRYYHRHFIRSTNYFDQQMKLDQAAFYKWQSILFQITPELKSQLVPKMKKPRLLWKKSKRMFQRSEYFMEEFICKTMLRQKQYRFGYLRFLGIGIGLMMVVPTWAKFILLGLLYFSLRAYMESIIQQILEHSIWSIFQVSYEQFQSARGRILKGFVDFPLLCILVILLIYSI